MASTRSRTWVWDLVQPLLPVFGEVAVLSLFVNLLALAVPVFVMQVYDRVIFHNGLNTLAALLLGMVVVLVFDFILRQARARILQTVALRIDADIGRAIFGRLVSMSLLFVEQRSTAFWHALFRDIDTVRNTLSGATALTLCDLLFFFLFLGLTFAIARPVAWILVAAMPLFAFIAWRSSHVVKHSSDRERRLVIARDTLIAEIVAGRATVKALALDQTLQPMWEERHAAALSQSIHRGATADRYATLGTTLTVFTTIAMTAVGALAVLDQQLTIGALIAANMLSGRLMTPITQLGLNWRMISSFGEVIDRLGVVLAAKPDRQESGLDSGRPAGRIAVEDVVFAHDEGARPALDAVRISFPPSGSPKPGGMHAIVGRNGSGKTTLLKVLIGLYPPARGRVLLDGSDIAQFNRRQLTTWIGYVPQETVLFAGTLRHNIALRVPDAGDEDIIRAARHAGAHAFIIERPDGYATEVGEAGQRLSAGQRQRIAIARALVGDPPVLVLDEPSNALDTQADVELRENLRELAKTVTIVVVTHSAHWLKVCQTITVLEQGRIVASGAADVVLQSLTNGSRGGSAPRPVAVPVPAPEPNIFAFAPTFDNGIAAEVIAADPRAATAKRSPTDAR